MVVRGCLSPDPSNRPEEQILPANVGVIVSSSDSEEEEEGISYEGYEVLPQEIMETNSAEVNDSDSEEDSCDETNDVHINLNIREPPSFDDSTKSEITELWDSSNSSRQMNIVIDSAKEEQIKNAMAGFVLPSTAIPSWAAHIPEEEWKEQLKNRIALLNKVAAV